MPENSCCSDDGRVVLVQDLARERSGWCSEETPSVSVSGVQNTWSRGRAREGSREVAELGGGWTRSL